MSAESGTSWDLTAVLRPVRRTERRLRLARMLRVASTTLLCALVCAIVVVALRKVGWIGERTARLALGSFGIAWLTTAIGAYVVRLAPSAGAVALDRAHALADRLSSALEFAALKPDARTEFMDAAIADALAHAPSVDPARAAPLRLPRDLAWAGALGVVLVGVLLFEVRTREPIASAKTIDALEVTPDDLDAVREFLRDMEQQPLSDDTKAAITEFNQLVDDLAQKRLDRTEAFRKLQTLEDRLLEGRDASAKELEEALAKVGEELKKSEMTKAAGEALEKRNLSEAAEQLRELAKKLKEAKEKGRNFDKAQIDRMREALKKASETQDARKSALDKKRDELQKQLLKEKQKLGDAGAQQEDEKSLLKKKERELERLERERKQAEQAGRQLDRLDRELSQAAEDLARDLGMSSEDLQNSAEDINRMEREKMTDQEKEQLRQRLQELRETLRQQGKGGKQQMARLQKFQRHARGGSRGQGQRGEGEQSGTGEQGQGQEGQGQEGQGQDGQGQDGQGQDGQGQQGQNGQNKSGQGQSPGQGEVWMLGPNGQKILMLSKGQGAGTQGQNGSGQEKGAGAGKDRGGPLQGAASNLKGQMQDSQVGGQDTGEGSSPSSVILGAAERGFASRGYTKVYRDYKNVAEEALNHDDIPGGYRFYVRRYFLLIRPRENP
jgi:hypothetical protein